MPHWKKLPSGLVFLPVLSRKILQLLRGGRLLDHDERPDEGQGAKAYLDYARSGLFGHDFGLKFFRVLIITKSRERLLNLKSAIEELTDRIFFFTTKEELCRSPWDRIWYRAGREGLFSLLEA